MKRLEDFRIFYNQSLHPELLRLEQSRYRLLRLLFVSSFFLVVTVFVQLFLQNILLTLLILIPVGIIIAYVYGQIKKFKEEFKPAIVNMILDFIDDDLNYGELSYDSKKFHNKSRFMASKIFATKAHLYQGEDFIKGRLGEMNFELCELNVREMSPVRNRLNYVFRGIFVHAIFPEDVEGELIVWPKAHWKYLTRPIKAFTRRGGQNVDDEIMNSEFREKFICFATEDTHVAGILPEPMQESLVNLRNKHGKEIYISFIGKEIYAAITEDKDVLEPHLFRSNISFDLVREFFEIIHLVLSIVETFDQTH